MKDNQDAAQSPLDVIDTGYASLLDYLGREITEKLNYQHTSIVLSPRELPFFYYIDDLDEIIVCHRNRDRALSLWVDTEAAA